jgi:hypothetical protein
MEHENMYASKGVAGAGLGLGIAGTALGLMAGGLNGTGLFGMNRTADCASAPVTRYEQEQAARIAALETEVKLRDSNIYTDGKILDLYKYVDGKFAGVEQELCQQRVYNATLNSAIGCINGQIAQLMALTKLVIPNGSVCPGWGNVTVTPATTTTA